MVKGCAKRRPQTEGSSDALLRFLFLKILHCPVQVILALAAAKQSLRQYSSNSGTNNIYRPVWSILSFHRLLLNQTKNLIKLATSLHWPMRWTKPRSNSKIFEPDQTLVKVPSVKVRKEMKYTNKERIKYFNIPDYRLATVNDLHTTYQNTS